METASYISSDDSLYSKESYTESDEVTDYNKDWTTEEINMIKFIPQDFSNCEFREAETRIDPLRGCAKCTYYSNLEVIWKKLENADDVKPPGSQSPSNHNQNLNCEQDKIWVSTPCTGFSP